VAEAALEGKQAKDRVEVRLEPEDAFGDYDESLLRVEPRSRFPEVLEVGMRFEGAAGGDDADLIFTVTDIAEDKVVLDANHALAGMALKLSCTVVGVRRPPRSRFKTARPTIRIGDPAHPALNFPGARVFPYHLTRASQRVPAENRRERRESCPACWASSRTASEL